jgi:hypothetical protein
LGHDIFEPERAEEIRRFTMATETIAETVAEEND